MKCCRYIILIQQKLWIAYLVTVMRYVVFCVLGQMSASALRMQIRNLMSIFAVICLILAIQIDKKFYLKFNVRYWQFSGVPVDLSNCYY